jgi:hypothetical protein
MNQQKAREDVGFIDRVGPIEIDWPQTVGYYGGIILAVAFDVISPPLGLFIAAIPVLKLFKRRDAPLPARLVSAVLEGAAKPVGGDSDSTIRVAASATPSASGAAAQPTSAGVAASSEQTPRRAAARRSPPRKKAAAAESPAPTRARMADTG